MSLWLVFSLQNVGVWGETGTLSSSDVYGTAVHEAWGEVRLCERISLKAGRQEIAYDDQRIFGSVGWAQQARSHDAAIVKIRDENLGKLDIGLAYNARRETLYKEYYTFGDYKAMQFLHWHNDFKNFGLSVLILNNGLPYRDGSDTTDLGVFKEKVAYSQTAGFRATVKEGALEIAAASYFQFGKRNVIGDDFDTTFKVSAMYFTLSADYKLSDEFSVGAGFEYLSGNDEKQIADDLAAGKQIEADNAFTPFYGTNHKFNGWMDYFYVGNHSGSVGLVDIYFPLKYKKDKLSAALIPHLFSSAGTLYDGEKEYDKNLGTEVDLTLGYAVSPQVKISGGFSVLFASESMEYLKSTKADVSNTWGWLMIDFTPTFYKSK